MIYTPKFGECFRVSKGGPELVPPRSVGDNNLPVHSVDTNPPTVRAVSKLSVESNSRADYSVSTSSLEALSTSKQRRDGSNEPEQSRRPERELDAPVVHQPNSHLDIGGKIMDGGDGVADFVNHLTKKGGSDQQSLLMVLPSEPLEGDVLSICLVVHSRPLRGLSSMYFE